MITMQKSFRLVRAVLPSRFLHAQSVRGASVFTSRLLNAPSSGRTVTEGASLPSASSVRLYSSDKRPVTSFEVQDYEDFCERVLRADKTILVDFYASWCGPCKLLAPRLESLVDQRVGKLYLAKVNVDDNPEIANEYNVKSVPHVVAIKKGVQIEQFTGNQEDETVNAFINRVLNE